MTLQQNPFDKFAHKVFSDLNITREFLSTYLPPSLSKRLNFSTLRLSDTKFVDVNYQEHRTDFLFEADTIDNTPLLIYLLFEHKSYADRQTLLQILRDMLGVWERELKNGQRQLTPILPIIFYHGSSAWPYPTSFQQLFPQESAWKPFIPAFEAILQDFSVDAGRPIHGSEGLTALLQTFRNTRAKRPLALHLFLHQILPPHLDLNSPLLNYVIEIVYHLMEVDPTATPERLLDILDQYGQTGEKIVESVASKLRLEGKKIGLSEGEKIGLSKGLSQGEQIGLSKGLSKGEHQKAIEIAKRMLGKFDVAEISNLTGLSLGDVNQLLADH